MSGEHRKAHLYKIRLCLAGLKKMSTTISFIHKPKPTSY